MASTPLSTLSDKLNLAKANFSLGSKKQYYDLLPGFDEEDVRSLGARLQRFSPATALSRRGFRRPALSCKPLRLIGLVILLAVSLGIFLHFGFYPHRRHGGSKPHAWQSFPRIDGYYNGIRTLVNSTDYVAEYPSSGEYNAAPSLSTISKSPSSASSSAATLASTTLPLATPFSPYPNYNSSDYLSHHYPVKECYLDEANSKQLPDVFAYPGVPQFQPAPQMGSYKELGIRDDVCFERFGRLGPYGIGYEEGKGGTGIGMKGDNEGSEVVWKKNGYVDWRGVRWGKLQEQCYERNKQRFASTSSKKSLAQRDSTQSGDSEQNNISNGEKKHIPRTAIVLRTWSSCKYPPHLLASLRAMITELSLKSGGEYDVHFLVHVKDNSIPIWASEEMYQDTLKKSLPEEFWDMATLWSEKQMELIYPPPFGKVFENKSGGGVHGVYRSSHFCMQYFASQHPEYDFFWNWEMDVRYSGHYYELLDRIGQWAKAQPRKGLWERNAKFYIPGYYGNFDNFTKVAEEEALLPDDYGDNIYINNPDLKQKKKKKKGKDKGKGSEQELVREQPKPIWGYIDYPGRQSLGDSYDISPPTTYAEDNYTWGVGEDADIITFNPLFDPNNTTWIFRNDVTGYNTSLPVPPRRVALITLSRFSRRLLMTMHAETYKLKHTMFTEMWPASCALLHGLKGVYAPHPVFFDRAWPPAALDHAFNGGRHHTAGGNTTSVFGVGEHNFQGSSFFYNAGFAGALWRRWLGFAENNEGGPKREANGTGRMCMRGVLVHPIKYDTGPDE